MATDTYPKAVALAEKIVAQSVALMDALRKFDALVEEHTSSGVDFAPGGEALDFSNASQAVGRNVQLKQCDGNDILACLSSGAAVKQYTDSQFHSTNLDKVRP